VVELLRKAIEWRRQLDAGDVRNQAEIARREGVTRARVTQVMGLLRLAREIQEHILSMPKAAHRPAVSEPALRGIVQLEDAGEQQAAFSALLDVEVTSQSGSE
jgi:ParB-like chromosome segregation protein Spo0J